MTNPTPLEMRLKADLPRAIKARDLVRVNALRTMLAILDNATAVAVDTAFVPLEGMTPDVPRREVSEAEQRALLHAELMNRRAAAERYTHLGKGEDAARLWVEAAVLAEYAGDAAEGEGA